ncbi:MAG: thiolase domain-containing protein, partial [Chloroflexi bacterium]|nr:thiolase domain-containing protein [Chloroflexota bacterium]
MRDVAIIGVGQTKVGEHWDTSLRHLALEPLQAAMADAGVTRADALYVGNMLSGELTGQEHLGALVADFAGLRGIETFKIEAACGSGAAALRVGYVAVAGGLADIVVVVGVEKMPDTLGPDTTTALAMAADGDYEAAQGVSFVAINALLMR